MQTIKPIGATCPLCQVNILANWRGAGLSVMECDAVITLHLERHTTAEWAACVMELRTDRLQLQAIPRWAMPQA